jgi:hypothetical protein
MINYKDARFESNYFTKLKKICFDSINPMTLIVFELSCGKGDDAKKQNHQTRT